MRYAWKNFAFANLYNREGFRVELFRTDHFLLPKVIVKQGEAFRKSPNAYQSSSPPTPAEDPR